MEENLLTDDLIVPSPSRLSKDKMGNEALPSETFLGTASNQPATTPLIEVPAERETPASSSFVTKCNPFIQG